MMGPYDPAEPLSQLIKQLKKGREFTKLGGHMISDTTMLLEGIILLAQMSIFKKDISEWRLQATNHKIWAKFNIFFH